MGSCTHKLKRYNEMLLGKFNLKKTKKQKPKRVSGCHKLYGRNVNLSRHFHQVPPTNCRHFPYEGAGSRNHDEHGELHFSCTNPLSL